MSHLIMNGIDFYRDLMENKSDPRVRNWPMMSSPFPTLIICLTYVYFSKSLGPKLMKKREPFDLRNTLIVYNFFQFIVSFWIFYEIGQNGWWAGYSFTCQPVDYSSDSKALRVANASWWYYISKFTEFLDTIFFILRKKNNQVSNLHVVHHGIMPFSTWIGLKFTPGGSATFFGFLNTFVHIFMYLYYMISAMGPKYQKYIWWKKYLTTIQIVQFVAILIHELLTLSTECDFPKIITVYTLMHGVLFLFLFSDFYNANYLQQKTPKINMPVEENFKISNGENRMGVTQRTCLDEGLSESKVCHFHGTCTGYIEDVKLVNGKKKD